MTARQDIVHMRHALRLAARGLGRVAPNPAVGCVIVAPDGRIVGVFPAEEESSSRPQSHVTFLINFADEIARRLGAAK